MSAFSIVLNISFNETDKCCVSHAMSLVLTGKTRFINLHAYIAKLRKFHFDCVSSFVVCKKIYFRPKIMRKKGKKVLTNECMI